MNSLRLLNRRVTSLLGRQSSRSLTTDSDSFIEEENDNRMERPRTERCINKVTLIGRLGKEGVIRGSAERPCVILPLATNFTFRHSETGEYMTKTDWHRICVFSPGVMSYAKRLGKGDRVYVEGTLSYQKIKDDRDTQRSITSIIAHEMILLQRQRGFEEHNEEEE